QPGAQAVAAGPVGGRRGRRPGRRGPNPRRARLRGPRPARRGDRRARRRDRGARGARQRGGRGVGAAGGGVGAAAPGAARAGGGRGSRFALRARRGAARPGRRRAGARGVAVVSPRPAPVLDVDALLDDPDTRIIVCCGSGGVGKTTTSAALAIRAAERGRRTVVLTIDPARRLAQALGMEALGNEPGRVAGARGELYAMMLDMRRTFDEMVYAHADPERAEAIIANPFYQTISSSFSGTQEYMAMEKLGQLASTGEWDLIVVDTPPSRSALDFLDAPQRMSTFLDGRMI